ncbi:2-oxoacid:acceptor oxidoreductase family protein [Aminivibrio sp.]|jgi:indolepyruvate ferredoxin oxidoreductase beta subunit|uniref:2-oxoacid:acceptor oxidoreductase family protein n=1 Tax=Aminivibrio sp. TaxID=1872489 RepID=UPI001A37C41A|nr:2-oxoacid:acceptor oxidoreductase family protein [Aminivibrio sp.]MBL3538795.1 2-oxoacid:acceptor oxidoreductase family protein [Aminivibrio sp.]MDK2958214.1 indolepyruvate ferredoxin oxidoreductase, beta subunit [Synergistaceae bacterium]
MQYVIVGIGGQGILFASKVLGKIALERGESVIGSEVHGMAQRGGSVISHFKVGDYRSPLVMAGEADILLAFDQNEAVRNLHFLKKKGSLVVNVHDRAALENSALAGMIRDREISVHSLEGYALLKEHMGGNFLFLNVLLMGAMCGAGVSGLSLGEVSRAVKELSPPQFQDANMKVLALGAEAISGGR